jgi:hypothetical protein
MSGSFIEVSMTSTVPQLYPLGSGQVGLWSVELHVASSCDGSKYRKWWVSGALPLAPSGRDRTQRVRRRIRLSGRCLVQGCGGAYERLEGIRIYFITLTEIDSAPDVAFKAGVEEP